MNKLLRDTLAQADQSFAESRDAMEALSWAALAALAAKAGQPMPPHIGRWLHAALDAYRSGKAETLDDAFGLKGRGKGNARRALQEKSAMQGAMGRMLLLHMLGATIPQAAAMVARISSEFAVATLASRYGRSGLGKIAQRDRRITRERLRLRDAIKILDEYPDGGPNSLVILQGKAAIRALYA